MAVLLQATVTGIHHWNHNLFSFTAT